MIRRVLIDSELSDWSNIYSNQLIVRLGDIDEI